MKPGNIALKFFTGILVVMLFTGMWTDASVIIKAAGGNVYVIYQLAKTKTVLLISHRLSNVTGSDCIYMLSEGEIRETGTHEQLMKMQGKYQHLYNSQQALENYGKVAHL
ncbi:hypothetical protein [Anaerostipes sp.]|uniref:hypothetical protein n=1 Tax=Anaerostipes sp. TaxID=1872530 RepID=UPI0025857367|nr:hypothetical protein [Anaerostipes sp.]MCI5623190.1 hypothetical protein [Anaerostipes sp.]MDY2726809.1 hypothetical protein [Anaerostipes faecalis]